MSYERVIKLIDKMHDSADRLNDDSKKSMMEGFNDRISAATLRNFANELTLAVSQDMIKPPTINVKMVTEDGIGSQYVTPEKIEHEDDGTLTAVVKAVWVD